MPKRKKVVKRPYNKTTGRNYKRDYDKFQSSEKSKKDRASRNGARRKLAKNGDVKKGDGKDVHHKGSVRNNSRSNLRVMSKSKNRAKR